MTREEALKIKEWRCNMSCSWRIIAAYAAETWPDKNLDAWAQEYGRQLCEDAREVLGETAASQEWD